MSKSYWNRIKEKDIPSAKGIDSTEKESLINRAKNYKMEKIVMGTIGVEQTKDAIVAIAAFVNAMSYALEDGKITLTDLPLLLNPAMKLPAALTGIGEIPNELSELDDNEMNELLVVVATELDLSVGIEELVTRSLIILNDIKKLVEFFQGLNSVGENPHD